MKNTVITSVAFLCISLSDAYANDPACQGKPVSCKAQAYENLVQTANGPMYYVCYPENAPDEILTGGAESERTALQSVRPTRNCAYESKGPNLNTLTPTLVSCTRAGITLRANVACTIKEDSE